MLAGSVAFVLQLLLLCKWWTTGRSRMCVFKWCLLFPGAVAATDNHVHGSSKYTAVVHSHPWPGMCCTAAMHLDHLTDVLTAAAAVLRWYCTALVLLSASACIGKGALLWLVCGE